MVSKSFTYTYTILAQHPFTNTNANTNANTNTTTTANAKERTLHVTLKDEKMAAGRSIKMYLTIFVATTCIYMVLYQYHLSRQPMPQQPMPQHQLMKNKDISAEADVAAIARKYNSFLWSPMSLFSARQPQQQHQQAQDEQAQQSISEKQSNATTFTTTRIASERKSTTIVNTTAAAPLSSPLQATTHTSNSSASPLLLVSPVASTATSKASNAASAHSNGVSRQRLIRQNDTRILGDVAKRRVQPTKTLNGTTNAKISKVLAQSIAAHSLQLAVVNSSVVARPAAGAATKGSNPLPPPLYIITPTYRRAEQLAELTRLGYTLKNVANLLWLVIEDANQTSPLVLQTLNRIGVPYEYFLAPMPEQYKNTKKAKPRGVSNRNRGLEYIRANATSGAIYFADDDNTYDISIFEQMRYTKKVSMWPVGLVTKFGVSTPIIRDGKITGFYDGWIGGRKFPVDMAGFAVSVHFLNQRPNASMPYRPGYEEDGFLKSLAPLDLAEIELLASNCTEILTWHTQTKKNANATALNMTLHSNTNLVMLDKFLIRG